MKANSQKNQNIYLLTERERRVISPPPEISVSEWADLYRVLSPRASKLAGRWLTARTPYLKVVMDSFSHYEVDEIVICFGTQLGKTESILNMIGYAIDVDPGPTLVVLPTEDIANSVSRNRIQPMVEASPKLQERKSPRADDFGLLEMKFETMTLYMAWSNSPSALSSKPVRYLFMDEVDKFPPFSGKEADPVLLAEKRTHSYFGFRKIVLASTPTFETGTIWRRLKKTDMYTYACSCPFCNKKQILSFSNVVWEGETLEEIKKTVGLRCEGCKRILKDTHKRAMLSSGEWVLLESKGQKEKIGFHLSSLYSPFVPLYELVNAFLLSKDDIAELMDFVNSYLAEPFKDVVTSKKKEQAKKCIDPNLRKGEAPHDVRAIVCGVDVQENGFYYTIWGIAPSSSYLLLYGKVSTWNELYNILDSRYLVSGIEYPIFHAFIDSGARTHEVYEYCRINPRCSPCKGASIQFPVKETIVEKSKNRRYLRPLTLFLVNTSFFKEKIFRMMDLGTLYFHGETDEEFIDQIVSEEKRRIRRGFRYVEEWVRINRKNHYLDATVYAFACAEYFNVRHFSPVSTNPTKPKRIYEKARELWIPEIKGWLKSS